MDGCEILHQLIDGLSHYLVRVSTIRLVIHMDFYMDFATIHILVHSLSLSLYIYIYLHSLMVNSPLSRLQSQQGGFKQVPRGHCGELWREGLAHCRRTEAGPCGTRAGGRLRVTMEVYRWEHQIHQIHTLDFCVAMFDYLRVLLYLGEF